MKAVCVKCEIVFLAPGEAPLFTLGCPVCGNCLKSYKKESKRIEVWATYNHIIVDLPLLINAQKKGVV